MSIVSKVADIISNLSSEDEDSCQSAKTALLTHSRETSGLTTLLDNWFGRLENLVDGGQRDEIAICMSRIFRYKATKGLDDWNLASLEGVRREFERTTKKEKQKDLLQAVRYFALAYPGEASLVEAAGWVQAALRCKQKMYGPAVLLLDALDSLATLPGVLHAARQTGLMLAHVFAKGEKRERCAGGRVALRVLACLEQGEADGSLEPGAADAWRSKLNKQKIVQVVVGCIDSRATDAAVERSLHLLAQLSMHEAFLKIVRTEEVLRVLVNDVMGWQRLGTSLFAILRQVLTSRKAANAFASIGGVGVCLNVLDNAGSEEAVVREMISVLSLWLRHATRQGGIDAFTSNNGLRICLRLLDEADLDAARSILALLKAWSSKATDTRSAFNELSSDISPLLSCLSSQDKAIAEPARVLVSRALHHPGDRAELATGLEDDAVCSLLSFLAKASQDAEYAVGAIACLIKAHVQDEKSAGKFAGFGIHGRLLKAVSDDCSSDEMLGAATRCLATLANLSTGIACELVSKGAVGVLLARLETQETTDGLSGKTIGILAAVTAIIVHSRHPTVAAEVEMAAIRRLVEVGRTWPPSLRRLAFTAILDLTCNDFNTLARLDDPLKEQCVRLTVKMVKETPSGRSTKDALAVLGTIFFKAAESVGQTFIVEGGPALLVHHIKLDGDNRDDALAAVLSIANNRTLRNVMTHLAIHANMNVAALCECFPPYTTEAAMGLSPLFEDAFGEPPQWPPAEVSTF